MDYVDSVSDNVSSEDKIKVECDAVLDTTKENQYISYKATDENNNISEVRLLIVYSEDLDKVKTEQEERLSELEKEIEEQSTLAEEERLRQ